MGRVDRIDVLTRRRDRALAVEWRGPKMLPSSCYQLVATRTSVRLEAVANVPRGLKVVGAVAAVGMIVGSGVVPGVRMSSGAAVAVLVGSCTVVCVILGISVSRRGMCQDEAAAGPVVAFERGEGVVRLRSGHQLRAAEICKVHTRSEVAHEQMGDEVLRTRLESTWLETKELCAFCVRSQQAVVGRIGSIGAGLAEVLGVQHEMG